MEGKAVLFLCAQALLAQCISSQCLGRIAGPCSKGRASWGFEKTVAAPSCVEVAPLTGVAPTSGGTLPIASASPISPSGIALASENGIEGTLAVTGELPFVSAVALEGILPTYGAGTVVYSCGDANIGIFGVRGLADGPAVSRDTIFDQCFGRTRNAKSIGPFATNRRAFDGLTTDRGLTGSICGRLSPAVEAITTRGGGLPIASSSPISPSGIALASDNAIEGILAVGGDLPFVSAVALEGILPTAGAGTVAYSCGDGAIGIVGAEAAPAIGLADGIGFRAGLTKGRTAATLGGKNSIRSLTSPFGRCGGIF